MNAHKTIVISDSVVKRREHRAPGARLSQPQHIRQTKNPWNFVRSFGNPGCCGWDTRVPFSANNHE
jgi:hypothetical protein